MFRAAARSSFRQSRQAVARRSYVTGHHTSTLPQKSDMPWVIGSALVFIPLFFSLTSPPGVHAQTHATSPNKEGLHEDVPAARKATPAEEPADKESSPSAAAAASADKGEDVTDAAAEAPKQEAAVATSTTRHDAKDVGEAGKQAQQDAQGSNDEGAAAAAGDNSKTTTAKKDEGESEKAHEGKAEEDKKEDKAE
ncbi:hypothetical protein JCM3774_006312 [Rhodotorula dairenensis]